MQQSSERLPRAGGKSDPRAESSLEALGDELNHDIDILRERQIAVRAAECRTQQTRGSAQIQIGFDWAQGEQILAAARKRAPKQSIGTTTSVGIAGR
jgi:hypothetical protein